MSAATPAQAVLRRLLAEKGIGRYRTFLLQQEGKELPGGFESVSGFVVAEGGDVFGFWLDWDARRGRYELDPWYRVEDRTELADDPEYRRARRQLRSRRT